MIGGPRGKGRLLQEACQVRPGEAWQELRYEPGGNLILLAKAVRKGQCLQGFEVGTLHACMYGVREARARVREPREGRQ